MTNDTCHEMQLLVQADLDGELTPAEAARVAVHLEGCAGCREAAAGQQRLAARLGAEVPYYRAPDRLRQAIMASSTAAPPRPAPASARTARWGWWPQGRVGRSGSLFGAGFALAACLALLVLLPRQDRGMTEAVIGDHIRSLQPGHLMDVISTDQHTVKPWFDGRLDFAPPVKDLAANGFPLAGGRLDYLDGREVAALVYRSRQHVVQLFVWPSGSKLDHGPATGVRQGYNFVRWTQDGMAFWAVSDLNAAELGDFVRLWQQG